MPYWHFGGGIEGQTGTTAHCGGANRNQGPSLRPGGQSLGGVSALPLSQRSAPVHAQSRVPAAPDRRFSHIRAPKRSRKSPCSSRCASAPATKSDREKPVARA